MPAQQPFRIDIHHHTQPQECLEVMKSAGILGSTQFGLGSGSPITIEQAWESPRTLQMMDTYGIATTILSDYAAYSLGKSPHEQQELARLTNTFFAHIIAEAPERFGAFACLPLPQVEAALEEMAYALDTLHLDGVGLYSNYQGRYVGDAAFDPVLAELQRRNAVVFVHPAPPQGLERLHLRIPLPVLEFAFDTTRAVTNLLLQGAFERYPAIRFIFAHAGGVAPYLQSRLALGKMMKPGQDMRTSKQEVAQALKHLYYDVALSSSPVTLSVLEAVTDPSHLLLGSDRPPTPEQLLPQMLRDIAGFAGFDERAVRMIERENALELFPRLT